jgi:regulator of protease activity HflC (stomatin/prohibitin superfamily)
MLFGVYKGTRGPGFCWIEPAFHNVLDDVFVTDQVTRLRVENVQTKDNVPIAFYFLLTTRVKDVEKNTVEVYDADDACIQRALSTVTEQVGNTDLDGILHNRDALYDNIKKSLQDRVNNWGIEVGAVELKDIKITDTAIEQAIAMKAKAGKEAEGELARARMQKQIAEALKEAADTFDEKTMWLKGVEVLLELCRSANNNTVIIPNGIVETLARVVRSSETAPE